MKRIKDLEDASRRLDQSHSPDTLLQVMGEAFGNIKLGPACYALVNGDRYSAAMVIGQCIEEQCSVLEAPAHVVALNPERYGARDLLRAKRILVMQKLVRILNPPRAERC